MQGAKGVSERGCFSTTSCSRHPQTLLDPDATPKEKEGEREGGRERGGEGREGWQTIKVPNSFPTVHFALSSLRRFGLFDLNTHTHRHVYAFHGRGIHALHTRRRVGFEGVTRNSVQGHGKKEACHG